MANYASLPNSVFLLAGDKLPYDSYTGDMVHRFYHMWQQSDCSTRDATPDNPSGCLNDLYPYVGIAREDGSVGNAMGFYNVEKGDAPVLKRLADEYTMSDNFYQSVMGGTFVQHMMLGTGDVMSWQPYVNSAGVTISQPPACVIVNPTPKSATSIGFTADKAWTMCDTTAPWVAEVQSYLASLPWHPDQTAMRCAGGKFYLINKVRPGFMANGQVNDSGVTSGSACKMCAIGSGGGRRKLTDRDLSAGRGSSIQGGTAHQVGARGGRAGARRAVAALAALLLARDGKSARFARAHRGDSTRHDQRSCCATPMTCPEAAR